MRVRVLAIMAILALVLAATEPRAERYGDNMQIALPLLALGCSVLNGEGIEYVGRYLVMFTGLHGTKRALGDAAFNMRPNGGQEGMPSGHTATAAFGASTLVQHCIVGHPAARAAVILAAGFTGASRIDANKHTIWQVLAGAIWGIICDMALRRGSRARAMLRRAFARLRGTRG